ncbi:MAG: hypothetical protein HRU30_05525 [Rhodobacteraceae bacterium]|nr:hypothetical protein [Paracoccaceae bacterium]
MIDLFFRNFDEARPDEGPPVEEIEEDFAEPPRELNLDDLLAEARQAGYDEGHAVATQALQTQYAESDAAQMRADHAVIQGHLAELLQRDATRQEATHREVYEMFLGIAERFVPEFLDAYGEQLALARVQEALQTIQTSSEIRVQAHPAVATALQDMLAQDGGGDGADQRIKITSDDTGPTANVTWREGRFEYCLDTASAALMEELHNMAAAAGLRAEE